MEMGLINPLQDFKHKETHTGAIYIEAFLYYMLNVKDDIFLSKGDMF